MFRISDKLLDGIKNAINPNRIPAPVGPQINYACGGCVSSCASSCSAGCKQSCRFECRGSCKGNCTGSCERNRR